MFAQAPATTSVLLIELAGSGRVGRTRFPNGTSAAAAQSSATLRATGSAASPAALATANTAVDIKDASLVLFTLLAFF
jgi:hypothetical protein